MRRKEAPGPSWGHFMQFYMGRKKCNKHIKCLLPFLVGPMFDGEGLRFAINKWKEVSNEAWQYAIDVAADGGQCPECDECECKQLSIV